MGFVQPVEDELGQLTDDELLLMFEEHPDEFTPQELLWAMNHDNEIIRSHAVNGFKGRPFEETKLLRDFVKNPNVPENFLLSVLQTEYYREVPLSAAVTVKVAGAILKKGSKFKTGDISKLARNRNAPVEVLLKLVDKNLPAKRAVATNPNLPPDVLRDLLLEGKCSNNVARNLSLRETDIVDFLVNRDHNHQLSIYTKQKLILHKNMSAESLKTVYSKHKSSMDNGLLDEGFFFYNKRTPAEVLEHLTVEYPFSEDYYKIETLLKHPNLTETGLRNFMAQGVELKPKEKTIFVAVAAKLLPEYAGYPFEWVAVTLGME